MDNQIPIKNKNIHNKHIYNSNLENKHEYRIPNKNLQNEIQPQMPAIKKPKIKDTEGLGGRIPIQNIENLALTIGGAALTGGATVAGQALLTGGTAGVIASGEAILGASIGSGVTAGASTLFGNTPAGNIASGIIGGIAGGAIGRKIARNRNTTPTEQTPLLGNRLGGRPGRNRLVIQPDERSINRLVPETEETRTPPQPFKDIKSFLLRTIQRKTRDTAKTVKYMSDTLMGKIKNTKRGTYARLPTEDVDNYAELPSAESRQDVLREIIRQPIEGERIPVIPPAERERTMIRIPIEGERIPVREKTAATKIQKVIRGNKGRKMAIEEDLSQNIAIPIQKIFRGYKTRKTLKENKPISEEVMKDMRNQIVKQQEPFQKAGLKIQKVIRGHNTRKTLNENRQDAQVAANDLTDQILGDSINEASGLFHDTEHNAPTSIQKLIRGTKGKKTTNENKFKVNYTEEQFKTKEIKN